MPKGQKHALINASIFTRKLIGVRGGGETMGQWGREINSLEAAVLECSDETLPLSEMYITVFKIKMIIKIKKFKRPFSWKRLRVF